MEDNNKRKWIGLALGMVTMLFLLVVMFFGQLTDKPRELPADNIYQQLAPMYSVCYIYHKDIICCAKPLINISTYITNKEVLVCDKLNEMTVRDKLLIIRD